MISHTNATNVLFYALLTLLLAYAGHVTISSILALRRNIRHAKASGLNYIVRPIAEFNYFFLVIHPAISALIELVPKWLDPNGHLDFYKKDWRFSYGYQKFKQLGDCFWNVSPGDLLLEVADGAVFTEMTTRRMDFQKQLRFLAAISVYGPNIVASEEETWKRHRRVIGPQFNDQLHAFAWNHATMLSREMFENWNKTLTVAPPSKVPNRELHDLKTLALRVVTGAAFESLIPFSTEDLIAAERQNKEDGNSPDLELVEAAKFSDSLFAILENLITFMIFPKWLIGLQGPTGRRLKKHFESVEAYMHTMIERKQATEKQHLTASKIPDSSFVSGLVASLVENGAPGPKELSYDEVTGNIFLMALAGSETTADTIHFALILLALHQDHQNWLLEQLDQVLNDHSVAWSYKEAFPRLKRMYYTMMEALRLYPATPYLTRTTEDKGQTLTYNGKSIYLPPYTTAVICLPALHYNPKHWGRDAAIFKPQRWEELQAAEYAGHFAAFSNGQRACIGRRFSEAEFIAVMATILKNHRVELAAVREGESKQDIMRRVSKALDNSGTYMTLSVGGEVPLRFVKR